MGRRDEEAGVAPVLYPIRVDSIGAAISGEAMQATGEVFAVLIMDVNNALITKAAAGNKLHIHPRYRFVQGSQMPNLSQAWTICITAMEMNTALPIVDHLVNNNTAPEPNWANEAWYNYAYAGVGYLDAPGDHESPFEAWGRDIATMPNRHLNLRFKFWVQGNQSGGHHPPVDESWRSV